MDYGANGDDGKAQQGNNIKNSANLTAYIDIFSIPYAKSQKQ